MIIAIVDTTVLIHLYRNDPQALAWADTQQQQLAVTSITWLEFLVGAGSKAAQTRCKAILAQFDMLYLTQPDQLLAMQQLEHSRLSDGVGIERLPNRRCRASVAATVVYPACDSHTGAPTA